MKRFLSALLVSSPLICFSQGTINFANIYGSSVNAPVYESDGLTKLSGSQFMAELLAGPSASSLGSVATTSFLAGNGAGYFLGGTQTIDSVPPAGIAWVAVDVWNTASGASFSQAKTSGLANSWWESSIFQVQTGSSLINPSTPGILTGLGNSPVYLNGVPEPSTFALGSLGAVIVLCRRRWFRAPLNRLTKGTDT